MQVCLTQAAVLATVLVLSACEGSTQTRSVFGRYSSVSEFGISLLELRPLNRYVQIESGRDTVRGSYAVRGDTVFLGQENYLGASRSPIPLIWRGDSLVLPYVQGFAYIRERSAQYIVERPLSR